MADFTKTITNSILVFGGARTDKWNSMVWGTNVWAFGDLNVVLNVGKVISAGDITLSDSLVKQATKVLTNTLVVSGDMTSEQMNDAAGYYVVWGSGSGQTNAENRPLTSFTALSDTAATYTEVSDTSTSWSEA